MIDLFTMGGAPMFPTALFGLLLLGVSGAYAFRPERRWLPMIAASSIMTLLLGALGFVSGLMATTLGGLARVDPERLLLISAIGFGESLANLALALGLCALAALFGCIGAARQAAHPAVLAH